MDEKKETLTLVCIYNYLIWTPYRNSCRYTG